LAIKKIPGNVLPKASGSFDSAFRSSSFYQFFRSYDNSENSFKQSLFYKLFFSSKLSVAVRMFKNTFARLCENSVIAVALKNFCELMLRCRIRSIGFALLYFSTCASFVACIKYAAGITGKVFSDNIFACLFVFICSLFMLTINDSVSSFTDKSKILSSLSANFFMDNVFDKNSGKHIYKPSHAILILIGVLFGFATVFFSVKAILLATFAALLVLTIFRTPENSLPLLIVFCPFLAETAFIFLAAVAVAAYIFKTLRGKRSFKIAYFDALFIFLIALIFTGGFKSATNNSFDPDILHAVTVGLSYFLFRNCTGDIRISRKCIYAIGISCTLSSLVVLYRTAYVSGYIDMLINKLPWKLSLANTDLFSHPVNTGEFLLVMLPFTVMASIISANASKKILFTVASFLCGAALICTNSKGVIMAFALCLLIYITASFRNPFASLITLLIICMALSVFIANSAFLGSDRFFNVNGYKETILTESAEIITDNFISGIGLGADNFAKVFGAYSNQGATPVLSCYNMYIQLLAQLGIFGFIFFMCVSVIYFRMQFSALSHNRKSSLFASLLAISSISAISVIYLRGLTSYVWNDTKILFMVVAVIGISASSYYSSLSNRISKSEDSI